SPKSRLLASNHPARDTCDRMTFDQSFIRDRIEQSAAVIASLSRRAGEIEDITRRIGATFAAGGRLYTCGNGGSAAEALHLAEELIGKYKATRPPYPAVALSE